jgi:hypothetical protein
MRDSLFIFCVVVFLLSFLRYADHQQEKHALNAYTVKCRNFGGEVELVASYRKPLCRKSGALFALDKIGEQHGYRN